MSTPYQQLLQRMAREAADEQHAAVNTFIGAVHDNYTPNDSRRARQAGVALPVIRHQGDIIDLGQRVQAAQPVVERPAIRNWLQNPINAGSLAGDLPTADQVSRIFGAPERPAAVQEVIDLSTGGFRRGYDDPNAYVRGAQRTAAAREARLQQLSTRAQLTASSYLGGILGSAWDGWNQTRLGAAAQLRDLFGFDQNTGRTGQILDQLEEYQARQSGRTPIGIDENSWSGMFYQGMQSLAQTAPALLTGNVPAALSVFFGTTEAQGYGKYRLRGFSPGMSALGGTLEGGFEAITELLPTRFLFGNIGKRAFTRWAAGFLGTELLGEEVATFTQGLTDAALNTDPDAVANYLTPENLTNEFLRTLVATGVTGGAVGGVHATARAFSRGVQQMGEVEDAIVGQRFLDRVMAVGEASAMQKEGDGAGFRSLISAAIEESRSRGNVTENVYIPAEVARSLMQEDVGRDVFSGFEEQVQEASALNGDVVMPIADAIERFSASPKAWEAVREHARLTPGGMSPEQAREVAKTYQERWEQEGRIVGEQVRAEAEASAPSRKVHDEVFKQLRTAGFSPNASRHYAELWAERYQARSERIGGTKDAFTLFSESLPGGIRADLPESLRGMDRASIAPVIEQMRTAPATAPVSAPAEAQAGETAPGGTEVAAPENAASAASTASDLRSFIESQGLDPETASTEDIARLIETSPAERELEQTGPQAAAAKALANGLGRDAALLRDIVEAAPFREKGLSGFDAPSRLMVRERVLAMIDNFEIGEAVVRLLPVDVVNVLARQQLTPDMLLNDVSMFADLLPVNGDDAVAGGVDIATETVRVVARAVAEHAATRLDAAGVSSNLTPAGDTGIEFPHPDYLQGGARIFYREGSKLATIEEFDPTDARILYQGEPFYSALTRAIENVSTKRAPAAQWKGTLWDAEKKVSRLPGVKAEELEWSGVLDWLDAQDGPVEKDALLSMLEQGGIKIEEVVLGEQRESNGDYPPEVWEEYQDRVDAAFDDWWDRYDRSSSVDYPSIDFIEPEDDGDEGYWQVEGDSTAYDTETEAQAAADEAHDEMVEEAKRDARDDFEHDIDIDEIDRDMAGDDHNTQFKDWSSDPSNDTYRELLITLPQGVGNNPRRSPSTHWDQEDVVLHVRFMEKRDASGDRVLFIEEVQSDWHQKGRDEGYGIRVPEAEIERLRTIYADLDELYATANNARVAARDDLISRARAAGWDEGQGLALNVQARMAADFLGEDVASYNALEEARSEAELKVNEARQAYENARYPRGIPEAPFKTSWPAVAMKRMIRWASERSSPASPAFSKATEPESTRVVLDNFFGGGKAPIPPFNAVDAGVIAALKHDQVRRAVVAGLPVDVVNDLAGADRTPDDLLGKPNVVISALSVDQRGRVLDGMASALRGVGATLRAELTAARNAGSDLELLPTLKASELDPRVVVGLLSPQTLYHDAAALDTDRAGVTQSPTVDAAAGLGGEAQAHLSATALADFLNWHERLNGKTGNSYQAPSGIRKIAWTTGEEQAERYPDSVALVGGVTVEKSIYEDTYDLKLRRDAVELIASRGLGTTDTPGGDIRMTSEQMKQVFGPPLAERMVEMANANVDAEGYGQPVHLETEGAEVESKRASGMKAFYDRNLVNITNDIIKKYGARVGKLAIGTLPRRGEPAYIAQKNVASAEESRTIVDAYGGEDVVRDLIAALERNEDESVGGHQVRRASKEDEVAIVKRPGDFRRRPQDTYTYDNAEGLSVHLERSMALEERRAAAQATPREPTNPGFEITDKLRDAAAGGFPLFQGNRGRIDIYAQGGAGIRLFEGHDLSTVLHEASHLWLEELRADAADPNAVQSVRDDWNVAVAWFKEHGFEVVDGQPIPTEAHEMWARGGERYFMEGKAPSFALRGAFDTFRSWLLRIYQVVANLRTPLNDDIRKVFDRLIATDQQIAENMASEENRLLPQDALGMTDAEYAALQQTTGEVRSDAMDALVYRTMEQVRKDRTKEYRRQRAVLKRQMAEEVDARPEFRALAMLRDKENPVRLDRAAIVSEYGEEALDLLPRPAGGIAVHAEGGTNPQILAEQVGLRTGNELLELLIGMEKRQRELKASGSNKRVRQEEIDRLTDAAMAERHGDILAEGAIEEEALAAIHNDRRATVIEAEARALGKKGKQTLSGQGNLVPTPWQRALDWARNRVMGGAVNEQATGAALALHRRNEQKAARAAEAAILADDVDEAFRQKQAQMYHHALFRAAKEAKDQVEAAQKRLNRYATANGIKGMDPEYLDRIHELLEAYDFKRRTQRDINERVSFTTWAAAKEEEGEEVYVPPRLQDAGLTHYSKVPVQDLIALDDAVQSIAFLGRKKNKAKVNKREQEIGDLVGEAVQTADGMPNASQPKERNDRRTVRKFIRQLDSDLLKIEQIADWMDRWNPNGVFNRFLIRGAVEAANLKDKLIERTLKPIVELYHAMPKEMQRRLEERVEVPEFMVRDPDTGEERPEVYRRADLLAVALNVGNESNFSKMVRGESRLLSDQNAWTQEKVMAVLNRELAPEDWQFVQMVWDRVNSLWDDIVRSEREISGMTPEKVEPRIVNTKHGALRGGYFPVVYDPLRSAMAEAAYKDDASKLFGFMGKVVGTPKGHTITRTDASAPILFNLEAVLFGHVNKVVTRIAYAGYARDALKFIRNGKIKSLVQTKLGTEYYRQLEPWLQSQINELQMDTADAVGIARLMRAFRTNATVVGLGFRFTTMLAQVGGLANTVEQIGPQATAQGFIEAARNMGKNSEFIFQRSDEMKTRRDQFDRDVRDMLAGMTRSKAGRAKERINGITKASMWGIANFQFYLVDVATWRGGYAKALSENMTEDEAVAYADKAVRMSQSSGRAMSLAKVQRGSEGSKLLTMFYSYFSLVYNKQRNMVHLARSGDPSKAMQSFFWVAMTGPLLAAFLTGDWPDDREEDDPTDDETILHWAWRKVFFGLFASLPLARDAAPPVERWSMGKPAFGGATPINRALDDLGGLTKDLYNVTFGDEDKVSKRWLQHLITTPGYFLGLPTGQAGATAQYGLDYMQGDQNPEDTGDVIWGMMKGPQKDQE